MRRRVAPPLLFLAVWGTTLGLAFWHPFTPAAATTPAVAGDANRGRTVFTANCSGCHGANAEGAVGPRLAGSGLSADAVTAVIAAGRGVMPAGIVGGQEAADVAAYVASIASAKG